VSSGLRTARIVIVLVSGPSEVRAPGRGRSSAFGLAFAACGADLGVGDLVGEQGVHLGGLGGSMAEAAAHDLDGHAAVDQLGGVRVAELVDADLNTGGGAVLLPPTVRRVVGQRAAPAIDAGAEHLGGRAVVMAVASVFGVVAVTLPFFYLHHAAALITSLALALALGIAIVQRRSPDLGWGKAYLLTFGVLAIAIGVTSAVSVLLPGSGG
jgi:hypothetical protein